MKKLLFATALSLLVSSVVCAGGLDASEQRAAAPKKAVAAKTAGFDLMHPFWGPAQGQFASDTTYSFYRGNYNENSVNGYTQTLAEKVLYGLTDNWTVFATVGREWNKFGNVSDRWHNKVDVWSVGTSYNFINDGKNFLQGALTYAQAEDNSWYSTMDKTGKSYTVEGTYGYNFDSVTPYAKVSYTNSANLGSGNDAIYGAFVGAYKKLSDKVGSTLGLDYQHYTSTDWAGVKTNYTLQADTSYMLTKNIALRVFADYLLDQKVKKSDDHYKINEGFGLGAGLKAAF